MNTNSRTRTQGLPIWIDRIESRQTRSGWRVTVSPNVFGLMNNPQFKSFRIRGEMSQEHAENLATHKAHSQKLYSQGCWLVAKCKEKYGDSPSGRKELFARFMDSIKRKYDGLDRPVYESEDAQREIAAALKLPLLTAAHSFPVGLVPA
jgi:hypothetical protein